MSERLSVKLWKDETSSGIDVAPAVDGINQLRQIVPELMIVSTSQTMALETIHGTVVLDSAYITEATTDIHVVMTDQNFGHEKLVPHQKLALRALGKKAILYQLGLSLMANNGRAFGTAIINTRQEPEGVAVTVAHEVGHLFGLKREGANWDKKLHCTSRLCLMTAEKQSSSLDKYGLKRFPCNECATQLRSAADIALSAKS